MSATFTWRVTCDKCGWTYPARELVAIKTDAEQNARDHRLFCPGRPLMETMGDDAA